MILDSLVFFLHNAGTIDAQSACTGDSFMWSIISYTLNGEYCRGGKWFVYCRLFIILSDTGLLLIKTLVLLVVFSLILLSCCHFFLSLYLPRICTCFIYMDILMECLHLGKAERCVRLGWLKPHGPLLYCFMLARVQDSLGHSPRQAYIIVYFKISRVFAFPMLFYLLIYLISKVPNSKKYSTYSSKV